MWRKHMVEDEKVEAWMILRKHKAFIQALSFLWKLGHKVREKKPTDILQGKFLKLLLCSLKFHVICSTNSEFRYMWFE